ncbi:MAG: nucleotidyltransferase domain-containing protein [bacterium]
MASVGTPSEAQLGNAFDLIEQRLRPDAILVYGSLVAGRLTPDSDIDIALLLGRRLLDAFELSRLRTDLEALLGRSVDLVNLDTASPILAMEVLRRYRIGRARRRDAVDELVARTLTAYFDLKRVRRPIEDAIRQRALAR